MTLHLGDLPETGYPNPNSRPQDIPQIVPKSQHDSDHFVLISYSIHGNYIGVLWEYSEVREDWFKAGTPPYRACIGLV